LNRWIYFALPLEEPGAALGPDCDGVIVVLLSGVVLDAGGAGGGALEEDGAPGLALGGGELLPG
jgi:hypothetical protein